MFFYLYVVSSNKKLRYGVPMMVFQCWLCMDGKIMQDLLTLLLLYYQQMYD